MRASKKRTGNLLDNRSVFVEFHKSILTIKMEPLWLKSDVDETGFS